MATTSTIDPGVKSQIENAYNSGNYSGAQGLLNQYKIDDSTIGSTWGADTAKKAADIGVNGFSDKASALEQARDFYFSGDNKTAQALVDNNQITFNQSAATYGAKPTVNAQGNGINFYQPAIKTPVPERQFSVNTQNTVTPEQTIEGRLNGVLGRDQFGNYSNDVVRQAVDRANETFAARGLLNSSMAAQAGQEAAISKAIEIVGPDAQRYFEQSQNNQNWGNRFAQDELNYGYDLSKIDAQGNVDMAKYDVQKDQTSTANAFNLRQNYSTSVQNINGNYTTTVANINGSNMSPEDKTAAIQAAGYERDSQLSYNNLIYSNMPDWSSQWSAVAVPANGVDLSGIGDINTLNNIINDPAQPADVRDKAVARRKELMSQPQAAKSAPTGLLSNGWTGGGD